MLHSKCWTSEHCVSVCVTADLGLVGMTCWHGVLSTGWHNERSDAQHCSSGCFASGGTSGLLQVVAPAVDCLQVVARWHCLQYLSVMCPSGFLRALVKISRIYDALSIPIDCDVFGMWLWNVACTSTGDAGWLCCYEYTTHRAVSLPPQPQQSS